MIINIGYYLVLVLFGIYLSYASWIGKRLTDEEDKDYPKTYWSLFASGILLTLYALYKFVNILRGV